MIKKEKVYIETTVISYLVSRPSRDIIVSSHQQITIEWWDTSKERFDIVASQLVLQEASSGEEEAVKKRLTILEKLELLEVTEDALKLARELIQSVEKMGIHQQLSVHRKKYWRLIKMREDPIVNEVREIRDKHSAKFKYDLQAIFQDLKEQEKKSGRTFCTFPPKKAKPETKSS